MSIKHDSANGTSLCFIDFSTTCQMCQKAVLIDFMCSAVDRNQVLQIDHRLQKKTCLRNTDLQYEAQTENCFQGCPSPPLWIYKSRLVDDSPRPMTSLCHHHLIISWCSQTVVRHWEVHYSEKNDLIWLFSLIVWRTTRYFLYFLYSFFMIITVARGFQAPSVFAAGNAYHRTTSSPCFFSSCWPWSFFVPRSPSSAGKLLPVRRDR